jgi:hypothetical protein
LELDVDLKNKRIDITGNTDGYIFVINHVAITVDLIKEVASLDPNSFYKFEIKRGGVVMERFFSEPKKDNWH